MRYSLPTAQTSLKRPRHDTRHGPDKPKMRERSPCLQFVMPIHPTSSLVYMCTNNGSPSFLLPCDAEVLRRKSKSQNGNLLFGFRYV
jgi:hypothetical protein